MARMFTSVWLGILAVGVVGPALAGPNQNFKVAVHVEAHIPKRMCADLPVIAGCGDIQTTYEGANIDFFPVFFDLVGYNAIEYGVVWPDAWGSCAYTVCTYSSFRDIRWPGDSMMHGYGECEHDPVTVPGWGWLYATGPGTICLVDPPEPISYLGVSGCGKDRLDFPVCNFCAGILGSVGDDPCGPTATESSTWSSIKALFLE
jgi:hypothetical protein